MCACARACVFLDSVSSINFTTSKGSRYLERVPVGSGEFFILSVHTIRPGVLSILRLTNRFSHLHYDSPSLVCAGTWPVQSQRVSFTQRSSSLVAATRMSSSCRWPLKMRLEMRTVRLLVATVPVLQGTCLLQMQASLHAFEIRKRKRS